MASRHAEGEVVVPLGPRALDRRLVGGKAASLSRSVVAGLPVPAGVVVTAQALEECLRVAGIYRAVAKVLERLAAGQLTPAAAHQALSERLLCLRLADDVAAAITPALSSSEAVESPFAVRSSATFEDGGRRSWAGQFTTVLGVSEDELDEAILECWRSAFSLHALSYDPGAYGDFGFAVVIQTMVDADSAGVLFSIDPTSGGERALLEATPGTGEILVGGGEVPLALYLQRPEGLVVRRRVSHPRYEALLLPDQISKLWDLALKAEDLFGGGVDIEWAITGDEVVLLQARPITAAALEGAAPELVGGLPDPSRFELTFKVGGLPFLMADILTEGFGYLEPFFVFSRDEFRQYFPNRIMDWAATEGYRWLRLEEGFRLYQSEFEDFYQESKRVIDRYFGNEEVLEESTVDKVWQHCSEVMRRYSRMDFQFTNLVAAYARHDPVVGANLERLARFKDTAREWVNEVLINEDSAFATVVGRLADQLDVSADLVVNLSREEVLSAVRRGFLGESAAQISEARSKAYAMFTSSQGVEYLSGSKAAELFERVVERERVLERAPLSGEVANRAGSTRLDGRAYVLEVDYGDPRDLAAAVDAMPGGTILFAEFTAPELMRACEKASGIVTDLGGMLSHAAIVSRELGVPCVVGTKVGTHVVRTGDQVQVDLESGSIEKVNA